MAITVRARYDVVAEGPGPRGVGPAVGHHHAQHAEDQQQQDRVGHRGGGHGQAEAHSHQATGWRARGIRRLVPRSAGRPPGWRRRPAGHAVRPAVGARPGAPATPGQRHHQRRADDQRRPGSPGRSWWTAAGLASTIRGVPVPRRLRCRRVGGAGPGRRGGGRPGAAAAGVAGGRRGGGGGRARRSRSAVAVPPPVVVPGRSGWGPLPPAGRRPGGGGPVAGRCVVRWWRWWGWHPGPPVRCWWPAPTPA